MNIRVKTDSICEINSGNNLSYVVNDETIFSTIEYKVLQNQSDGVFIKCMQLLYNGKIQLYYLTERFKPFTVMLHNLDSNAFLTIVSKIFADIICVKNNGFLTCQNIDISLEHIYVEPTTYKIGLVYLPLSKRIYADYSTFENEFRTSLIELINNLHAISSPRTVQLAVDLSNRTLSLEDIHAKIKGFKSTATVEFVNNSSVRENRERQILKLIATNSPTPFEITVSKDEFVIGKKPEMSDGVIPFNKLISRKHCKITKNSTQFMIFDLESVNGTYVNSSRVLPGQAVKIEHGDVIRLANSEFQVRLV